VYFFLLLRAQKKKQEKGTRVSCPAAGGMPGVYAPLGVLLDAAGALQTRCAQTVQSPFSAASPVLGCVPMGTGRKKLNNH
jgi:hypothetical protein